MKKSPLDNALELRAWPMATHLVHRSDRAASAATAAGSFLRADPVRHNLVLTLLAARLDGTVPGRYWWVAEHGEVQGVALQSPTSFSATVTPMPTGAIASLVDAAVAEAPDLPGVNGEAATAAAFAGAWTERTGGAALAAEAQRLYAADRVVLPTGVGGTGRPATAADVEQLADWFVAFHDEVGGLPAVDGAAAAVAAAVADGRTWVWEDGGELVSSAQITRPVVGAARIGFVYTPSAARGHGYAAAVVGALAQRALDPAGPFGAVGTTVLYTQLRNAGSNRIYRRLGFRSVAEVLAYRFEST